MKELVYDQKIGVLWLRDEADPKKVTRLGKGYAGHPPFVNDPAAQALVSRGPIPRGKYRVGRPFRHNRLGPAASFLEPFSDNEMFGRSGFFIHGDNSFGDQSASHGCIILKRSVREEIAKHLPIVLVVV